MVSLKGCGYGQPPCEDRETARYPRPFFVLVLAIFLNRIYSPAIGQSMVISIFLGQGLTSLLEDVCHPDFMVLTEVNYAQSQFARRIVKSSPTLFLLLSDVLAGQSPDPRWDSRRCR